MDGVRVVRFCGCLGLTGFLDWSTLLSGGGFDTYGFTVLGAVGGDGERGGEEEDEDEEEFTKHREGEFSGCYRG